MPDTVTVVDSAGSTAHQIFLNYFWNLIGISGSLASSNALVAPTFETLARAAILYHDYALTLGEEVKFFWGGRPTAPSVLYFLNRYISILGTVPIFLQVFGHWSSEGCTNLQKYHQFLSISVQIVVGVIMILRTYALYELNRKLLIVLSLCAFGVICAGISSVFGDFPTVLLPYNVSSFPGCHTLISAESGIRLAGAWGSLLLFDTLVIILTMRKAIIVRRLQNRKLFHVLIRDGTIYYIVFSLINLGQILLFVIGKPQLRGLLTTPANAVSSTLISRLMLNLKNPRLFDPSHLGGTTYSTLGAFVAPGNFESRAGAGSGTDDSGTLDDTLFSTTNGVESWKSQGYSDQGLDGQEHIELTSLAPISCGIRNPHIQDPIDARL